MGLRVCLIHLILEGFMKMGYLENMCLGKSGVKSCALLPSQMGTNALLLLLLYQTNNIWLIKKIRLFHYLVWFKRVSIYSRGALLHLYSKNAPTPFDLFFWYIFPKTFCVRERRSPSAFILQKCTYTFWFSFLVEFSKNFFCVREGERERALYLCWYW